MKTFQSRNFNALQRIAAIFHESSSHRLPFLIKIDQLTAINVIQNNLITKIDQFSLSLTHGIQSASTKTPLDIPYQPNWFLIYPKCAHDKIIRFIRLIWQILP